MTESAFKRAVVRAVSLSCLLTMDYVPKSKPPPIKEMTRNELPRILGLIPGVLVPPSCADPAALLETVSSKVIDFHGAEEIILERGHEDMVFSVLQYMRKPPTATIDRIRKISVEVARVLKVDIPDGFDDTVGDAYDRVHRAMMRV